MIALQKRKDEPVPYKAGFQQSYPQRQYTGQDHRADVR
jgi:hypothetical protein